MKERLTEYQQYSWIFRITRSTVIINNNDVNPMGTGGAENISSKVSTVTAETVKPSSNQDVATTTDGPNPTTEPTPSLVPNRSAAETAHIDEPKAIKQAGGAKSDTLEVVAEKKDGDAEGTTVPNTKGVEIEVTDTAAMRIVKAVISQVGK